MIQPSKTLEEFERNHAREHASRSYAEALAIYAALWREAVVLNPDFPGDWRDDLSADLAVARAVNGLPPEFASAEDLLLHKLFAGRPRDLEDAAGIVRRKSEDIDWEYVEHWAQEFAAIPGRESLPDLVRGLRPAS